MEETHVHLIQCTHEEMVQTFNSTMDDLEHWLISHTSEEILADILQLARTFQQQDLPLAQTQRHSLRLNQQLALGSKAFFAGLWSKQWLIDQDTYYKSIRTRRQSHKWMAHIISKIQLVPLGMWHKRNSLRSHKEQTIEKEERNRVLNQEVDAILGHKPHDRLMAHCDRIFFRKHSGEQIKAMKEHRKKNWITGAKLILDKYDRIETPQSARFTSYFQWDRG
jgi:hypothetical protein